MYIAYKNVAARGIFGCGTLSPSFASLTRGYALSEISTLVSPPDYKNVGPHAPNGPEQILNPADIFTNCSSISYNPSSYNKHCYPSLIYPHGMQDVDTAWRSCTTALKGNRMYVPDPPRVLTPVAALGPATTRKTAPLAVTSASPAPTLFKSSVTKTDTPMVLASTPRSKLDPQQPSSVDRNQASNLNVGTKTERPAAEESSLSVNGGSKAASASDTRGPSLGGTHATIVVKPQSLSDSSDGSDAVKASHLDSAVSETTTKRPDSIDPTPTVDSNSPGLDDVRGDGNPKGHPGFLGALASMVLSAFQPHTSLRSPEQTSHPSQPTKVTDQGFASLQLFNSLPRESTDKFPLQALTHSVDPSAVSFAIIDEGGLSLAGTAHQSGPIIIAGSTLKVGATAVPVQGHQISVDPMASNLIFDGQTLALPSLFADAAFTARLSISSIASKVAAQADSSQGRTYIINGQTLTPGGGRELATISGTPVGFDADGDLVVETSVVGGFHDDKNSILDHQHPSLLTLGSLTLTIGIADQGDGGDDPTPTGRQATIASRTHSLPDEGGRAGDRLPATTTEVGNASIYGSEDTTARKAASTSRPNEKLELPTQGNTISAQSSTLTSAMSAISIPVRDIYTWISTLVLWCLVLT